MADYMIIPFQGGEFGIRAESDRAGSRSKHAQYERHDLRL